MDAPPPAPWSFAARAAYFGGPICPVCDHRNPAGARFCSDCGSPLDLKRCKQCDAINHQAATNCYNCGAECPTLQFTTTEATPVLPVADPASARRAPGDRGIVTPSLLAAEPLRAGWRMTALATILIAGTYAAYRINGATPDAMIVASQPIGAREQSAATARSAAAMALESAPVERETTAAALEAPSLTTKPGAPKRAGASQTPVPAPTAKRANAGQTSTPVPVTNRAGLRQTLPARQAPVRAIPPKTRTLGATPVRAPDAETRLSRRPDPWQAMQVGLASCRGDLIDRIVCDQRVRRHFCAGRWGEAPACGIGIANDRGQ